MRVVVTGAAGRIGASVVEELSQSHQLALMDVRPVEGMKAITVDLSRRPAATGLRRWLWPPARPWRDAFKGAEVVVHLAAAASPRSPWERVLTDNIEATANVLESAAEHGVRRVIFASSNWAVKGTERRLAPACFQPEGPKITSDAPPSPLTPYGLSKAFGELAGRMYVDEGKLESFVAVRIGHFDSALSADESLRGLWIGVEDTKTLFRKCVEAEFTGFHVVYGVSAQAGIPYDLSHTRTLLRWNPRQTG
jgi:nucleoside-diphosphate-sugar epimerase